MTAITRSSKLFILTLLLFIVVCECKKSQSALKKNPHATTKSTGSYRSGSYKSSAPQKRSTRLTIYRPPAPKRAAPLYTSFNPTPTAASMLPAASAPFFLMPQPMFTLGNWNLNAAPLTLPRRTSYQNTSPLRLVVRNRDAKRRSDDFLDESNFMSSIGTINTNIGDILPRGVFLDLSAFNKKPSNDYSFDTNIANQLSDILNSNDFSSSDIAVMSVKPSFGGSERFGGIRNFNANDLFDMLGNQYDATFV